MFDKIKNMTNMLGQARELKQKMEQMRAEMATRTVEGDAGAGAVRVVVNGNLEVISVHLGDPLFAALARPGGSDEATQRMVEGLIAVATNDALARVQQMIQEEMSKAAGGLDLPGMDKI